MKILLAAGWAMASMLIHAQVQTGNVQSFRLSNGLKVVLLEEHERSLLRLQLLARWAPLRGSEAQAGLAPLALKVLEHCGAGGRSHDSFCRNVEEQGLCVQFSSAPDGPSWTLLSPSTEAESAFAFLAEVTSRALPEEGGIETQRLRLSQEIEERSAAENARSAFLGALNLPDLQARPITTRDLTHLFLETIEGFIHETLSPSRAVLAISGDLSLAQARQLAILNFGAWADAGTEARTALKNPSPQPSVPWAAMSTPADEQELLLALPYRSVDASTRASVDLLALLLPRKIKTGKAWIRPGADRWRALIIDASGTAVQPLEKELLYLKENGFDSVDLAESKLLWNAHNLAMLSHPKDRLALAATDALLGPGPGPDEINAVDLAALNATLRVWLNLDEARVLTLGGEAQASTPKREAKSK